MSKNKKENPSVSAEGVKQQQKVGIFFGNFVQVTSCGHQSYEKHIKRWSRGQLIWNEKEIEDLIKLGAPIEVFYRWL